MTFKDKEPIGTKVINAHSKSVKSICVHPIRIQKLINGFQ